MTSSRARHGRSARWALLGTLGAAAIAGWFIFAGGEPPRSEPARAQAPSPNRALLAATSPAPASEHPLAAEPPQRAEAPAADTEVLQDDGAHMHPHPITEERLALLPPWETVDLVRAALEAKDFERARQLLARRRTTDDRRAEFADFYAGLEIMTDCLESPGAASRARAKNFLVEHRASPLRRHVRRKCLAAEAPASAR